MPSFRSILPVFVAGAALGIPAHAGLIITPIFDSSITNDAHVTAIEAAINSAITVFENTYSNPITVPIYFQEGGGLGQSEFFYNTASYQTYYNDLVSKNGNAAAIAGLTANGGNSAFNPVTGTDSINLKSAGARAVGIDIEPGCVPTGTAGVMHCAPGPDPGVTGAVDGIISLYTAITTPGSPGSTGTYDLIAVAEHELDEILGLGSSLLNVSASSGLVGYYNGDPAPEDLFRYTQGGALITTDVNCAASSKAYFSYSGTVDIAQFNNSCNGADFGDWATLGQVQSAFASSAPGPAYGASEIAALSAIGYDLATPEPSTWTLLLAPFVALAGWRFRRSC